MFQTAPNAALPLHLRKIMAVTEHKVILSFREAGRYFAHSLLMQLAT